MRSLPGPYKILWDYLYHDCDHAGIWQKDFQIAQIYVGVDMPINEPDALKLFNLGEERIVVLDEGSKWLVRPFIEFQYGNLNPENRVHASVLHELEKHKIKDHPSPLQRAKEKEKDKDKDISQRGEERRGEREPVGFADFWSAYPRKRSRGQALNAWRKLKPSIEQVSRILAAIIQAKTSSEWVKDGGQFIPYPATWLNAQGWEDEIKTPLAAGVDEFQRELERRRELSERANRVLSGK